MNSERPVIRDFERTRVDLTLEALTLIGVLFLVGIVAYYYASLPDTVPQHFNSNGDPDGWGGKNIILILPAIGVGLYLLLTVLSRYPHVFNYPWPITESNARRQYAISRQMIAVVKLVIVITFCYITWSVIGTALGRQHGLGVGFTMFEMPLLIGIIVFYVVQARRAR